MRALVGILIAALLALGIYWFYLTRSRPGAPGSTPVQTIDASRAKMDLLAIAQAERTYFAEHGSYASLDELVTSGAIPGERTRLEGFSITAETQADGFTLTARCQPPPGQSCTSFAVDQSMSVHSLP
jgi:hypothetical protein